MTNMIVRINTILTMMMGEVNLDYIGAADNHTTSPFKKDFWVETETSQ